MGQAPRFDAGHCSLGRLVFRFLCFWFFRPQKRLSLFGRPSGTLVEGESDSGLSGLSRLFGSFGALRALPPANVRHAYYKYYVFVEPEALKSDWSRDRIMTALMAEGIPCGSGSCSEI